MCLGRRIEIERGLGRELGPEGLLGYQQLQSIYRAS
jgi:hypothetical protein